MEASQRSDDNVLHEQAHDENIREELEDASAVGVLTDIPAAAAAPTQAEFNALRASHNSVLTVLRNAGLIPTA